MSFSQFGTNANRRRKKVFYEGVDTIREGMPVAYNNDTTDNILGIDTGVDPQVKSSTTTAGGQNEGKFQRVELLTVDNRGFLAGFVAGGSYDGLTGPRWIDINVPNGSIIPVRTDKSITELDRLYLEAGQQTVVNDSSAMPCIGVAMETIDRSSTAGTVLAKVDPVDVCDTEEVVTAHSRTAVQLPTAAIWDNFNLKELRENPMLGSFYEADFKRGNADYPINAFTDAASLISLSDEAAGGLVLLGSVDNEACEVMYPCPIAVSGGKKWAMEARLKTNTITANDIGFYFGLMVSSTLTGILIADNGAAVQAEGSLGFQSFHADTAGVDAVYDETSQSPVIHDADVKAMTVNTYFTVGMYFDGTDIQVFVDGVNTADPILASDIAAADFPTAAVLQPTLATKNGAAEDDTVTYDWVRFAQEG